MVLTEVSEAKAEVKGEIARTDSKASLLLAFDGVALAGVWTVGTQPWVPVAARAVGSPAIMLLLGSVALLLRVVRPRLSTTVNRVGFPRWAELTPQELTAELAEDRTSEHVVALSGIAAAKMRSLQAAVDLIRFAGAPLLVAAFIAAALAV